jgi:rubrerythrin
VSDYPANAKQAAPPEQLEAHIMSASTPKGDAEWWAMGEIQRLRAELAEARLDAERYRWLRDQYLQGSICRDPQGRTVWVCGKCGQMRDE